MNVWDLAEDGMFAVKVRRRAQSDEELRAVLVSSKRGARHLHVV